MVKASPRLLYLGKETGYIFYRNVGGPPVAV